MSNIPFGAETADAPWNRPDRELPCCAQCGVEAERGYPDQADEDIASPVSDASGRDFCSGNCAIEFSFMVRRRRGIRGRGEDSAELRQELSDVYAAAVVLANLSEEGISFLEETDESQGLLEIGRADEQSSPAEASKPGVSPRLVDLAGLRSLADDLCGLLGGKEDDPAWLSGDAASRAAEERLEGLVEFRTQHFPNEVWPFAKDLNRRQIAGLYEFYVAQTRGGRRNHTEAAAG